MQTKKEQFLAMAEAAEKNAKECRHDDLKEEWLKIAKGYRKLAANTPD